MSWQAVGAESASIARAIDLAADRFKGGGRLIYVGAGTSGRLGVLDASECPPTFGTPPEMVVGLIAGGADALTRAIEGAEDDPDRGATDLERIKAGPRDLVVGIATSGRTPYVLGAVKYARSQGAATIGIACNRPSLLGALVDVEIALLVGPEVVAGSTRLKAGTATKMVLNMITTGAMIRIGKTLGNRMIDLQPTNEKLRIRSRRMLREIAGIDDAQAADLLERSGGRLKLALLMALAGVDRTEAERLLDAHGGQVRAAVRGAHRGGCPMNGVESKAPALLGIDGGGTSTVAWLADAGGKVLGRGRGGPSNAKAVGAEAARRSIQEAIARAFDDLGMPARSVSVACLGLAGFDRPEDRRLLSAWTEESGWADRLVLVNDGDLVLAAGTPEGWGLGVIAGTGSIAVGRTPDGRIARAGGWGPLIGDEGSAYAVVLKALRRIARQTDGRDPRPEGDDPLTCRLCGALEVDDPRRIVTALHRARVRPDPDRGTRTVGPGRIGR